MRLEYAYLFDGELYKELLDGIPKGKYFDNRATIIPFENASDFRVFTNHPNEIHYISIACENGPNVNTTIIPSNSNFVLRFSLPRGLNTITVLYDEHEYVTKSFTCTYFGTILYAYAQSINNSCVRFERLDRDIYNQEATRLTSPVQHYSKQLTDSKPQRIFGLQLITRALINSPGTFESLEDICKAVYISTPIIKDIDYKNIFDLSYYSFAGQEYELGKIVYLWVRNPALVRKLYGLILANNFGIPTSVTDSTLENEDGFNEYLDSDKPIIVDDNGNTEYDEEKEDGYLEISIRMNLELPRLDRNLPIPFIKKHSWFDREDWKCPENLDSNEYLDIADWYEPLNKGRLLKQEIPYRYDGSKVSSLIKVTKLSHAVNGSMTLDISSDSNMLHGIITDEDDILVDEYGNILCIREDDEEEHVHGHGLETEDGDVLVDEYGDIISVFEEN